MTRRPAMTMTETLVAIFVVAIGLAGVMSMYPFAAKQMSDALVSDRSTTHATSTDGLVRSYWKEKVVANNGNKEPFWDALDNPGGSLPAPLPNESSYPVFLDPMGEVGRTGTNKSWVGDTTGLTRVPRRNMNLVLNSGDPSRHSLRLFSQADGFTWDDDSQPKPGTDMRELRYNSLAVIQRPTNRDKFGATLKVVVFINRRHFFYPTGSEAAFGTTFTPGSTQLQLSSAADIKKGSWLMDATVSQVQILPATTPPTFTWIRHANFYRVVSLAENTTGTYDIELHTAVRRVDGRNNPATDYYAGTVVVMAGAADVFERPVLTGNTNP